jgi:2-hydroxy-6-oxonona-2,4-dienedioate hydrolase
MLGHGYTGKPDYDYEIQRYVEHLRNFLVATGIEQANLAGESLGGWVAAAFAAASPTRVKTIQLIAAGGTKANPEIMERIKTSTRQAGLTDDRELTHKRLNLLMHNPAKDVSDELVDVRHRIYHQPDFVRNVDHLLCLQEMEVRQRNLLRPETLAKLAGIPTLIIWGRNNPFGDVPEAHKMHDDIPGSELVLFEDCGHWPQHEHADRYNALAIEFLDKHNR